MEFYFIASVFVFVGYHKVTNLTKNTNVRQIEIKANTFSLADSLLGEKYLVLETRIDIFIANKIMK